MSGETSIRKSLQIRNGNVVYNTPSGWSSFRANMAGTKGPTPGSILIAVAGTDINLSALSIPGGWCEIVNVDPGTTTLLNYVEIGAWDPDHNEFFPLFELLPGEGTVVRLSRHLGAEYGPGPGTGTAGSGVTLRLRAPVGPCQVYVGAFDA